MHVQAAYEESDTEALSQLIRTHPLATLIVHTDQIEANHMPMILSGRKDPGDQQTVLCGHIPRANELWRHLDVGSMGLAVFQGPQAYITPAWYPSKTAHGKVVPTWNYAIVHVRGHVRAVRDREWLLQHVNELTDQQEAASTTPTSAAWKVSDAPDEYIEKLLSTIVGIELTIESMTGKWKMSQNKSATDRAGVSAGLLERGTSDDVAMSAFIFGRE